MTTTEIPTVPCVLDDPSLPDLASYVAVHRALRRGSRALADAARRGGDRRQARATAWWARRFLEELHLHHTLEDDHFFPALLARAPEVAALLERTDADHAEMDRIVAGVEAGLATWAQGGAAGAAALELGRLADLLDAHLALEDDHLLGRFQQAFGREEYAELEQVAIRSLGVGPQAAFTVPFVVSMADDPATALAEAPAPFRALHRLCAGRYRRRTRAALGADLGAARR